MLLAGGGIGGLEKKDWNNRGVIKEQKYALPVLCSPEFVTLKRTISLHIRNLNP